MIFSLFKFSIVDGFSFDFFEIDTFREDDICPSLLGIQYDNYEKYIGICILWRYFQFNLSKQQQCQD